MVRTIPTPAASADPEPTGDGSEPLWRPDLLPGYESCDLALTCAPAVGEPPDAVTATLVRRVGGGRARRAVLYLHGWNDYFFHTHVGDFFADRGYAFYALDLRRYGRSFREGQLGGYVDHLEDYFEELDLAYSIIAREVDSVTVMAHSTGGLVASLWADARRGLLEALLLNSPWLDLHGPPVLAGLLSPALQAWSRRDTTTVIPLPDSGGGLYARSLHRDQDGEWDYDLALKSPVPVPIRVGWLKAILAGHAAVAKGLDVGCPVFVATSTRSLFLRRWSSRLTEADVVLDVEKITAKAWRLGNLVTVCRIEGGMHDLALSKRAARDHYFGELDRWLRAYAPAPVDAMLL